MDFTRLQESDEYRHQREELRIAELELIDHVERVTALRRHLPADTLADDYELIDVASGDHARVSELFTAPDRAPLWHELYEGNYHRMSSVMANELPEVMSGIIDQYGGSVARLVHTARSREEISQRLQSFKGIGPKTAEIFLREVPDASIGTA